MTDVSYPCTFPVTGPATWEPTERPVYDGGSAAPVYTPLPSADNGGTVFMNRAGALTGIANGKQLTVEFVFSRNAVGGSNETMWSTSPGTPGQSYAQLRAATTLRNRVRTTGAVEGYNDADSVILFDQADTRYQIIYSADMAAGDYQLFVNGVADSGASSVVVTDTLIDWAAFADWFLLSQSGGGALCNLKLSRHYLHTGHLDLANNVSTFWDGTNPVDYGADGSGLLGVQPLVLFDMSHQTLASLNAGTNLGTGGTYPVTGTFTDGGDI